MLAPASVDGDVQDSDLESESLAASPDSSPGKAAPNASPLSLQSSERGNVTDDQLDDMLEGSKTFPEMEELGECICLFLYLVLLIQTAPFPSHALALLLMLTTPPALALAMVVVSVIAVFAPRVSWAKIARKQCHARKAAARMDTVRMVFASAMPGGWVLTVRR